MIEPAGGTSSTHVFPGASLSTEPSAALVSTIGSPVEALDHFAASCMPPVTTTASPLSTIRDSSTGVPLGSTVPVSRVWTRSATTFVARSCAPLGAKDGVAPSARRNAPSAADQVQFGVKLRENTVLNAATGVPATTADAAAAVRAIANCAGGGAEWSASACAQKAAGVPNTLCGAGRALDRAKPSARLSMLRICTPEAATWSTKPPCPPEKAIRPRNGAVIPASIGRTDRIGPTESGTTEWYTATKRVTPPSTSSSQTTSAWSRPVCGRTLGSFSILTASAGRLTMSPAAIPVSGQVAGTTGAGGAPLSAAMSGPCVTGAGTSGAAAAQPASARTAHTATIATNGRRWIGRAVVMGTSKLLLVPALRPAIGRHSTACAYAESVTRPLRTLPVGPEHLDTLVAALRDALGGGGPAVRPSPVPVEGPVQGPVDVPDDVALVVETSGSTGTPCAVMLSAAALSAAATATDARLGGASQWLLTLPLSHIAGLQILVRSILAGTDPVVAAPGGFRPRAFAADAARLTGPRRSVSLVPTQLHRLLDDAGPGLAALVTFDTVLLGGAASSPALLARAAAAGVQVTTTYGMSETCGGCVYDGAPLDGVRVRRGADGRVLIAGPVLATGYLGRPDLDAEAFIHADGARWLRTNDVGEFREGHLTVLGRLDDVLVTGGTLVWPTAVERLIADLPGVAEVCVVGVPDAEWGQAVVAVVVAVVGGRAPTLGSVRAHVSRSLGAPAAPQRLVIADRLPSRGPGKVDRRAVAELAAARLI